LLLHAREDRRHAQAARWLEVRERVLDVVMSTCIDY
jgi:hypothetical protein